MEGYDVSISPASIAPTVATRTEAVEVFGQPRMTQGHPCTVWDQEDIDHYKEMLKTSKELQVKLAEIKKRIDDRMADPKVINILPPLEKGPDGKWLSPGSSLPPHSKYPTYGIFAYFSETGRDVSDLGILYVLTGDEKYGEYAKKILLSYANCLNWPAGNINLRNGVGIMGGMLQEALIMSDYIHGYDMIYNLPSWTPEERKQIHDEFIQPIVACYLYPVTPDKDPKGGAFASQVNNRGSIATCAVLMAGYATDDQELVNAALYGVHTDLTTANNAGLRQFPPPKDWIVGTAEKPDHGLLNTFFAEATLPGGMWCEGSTNYTFYALGSYINSAETLWHHGIDLYRHNNAIFKNMFDYPILFSYPDMSTPSFGDSGRSTLIGSINSGLYEYGYRRYRDPRYLAMINAGETAMVDYLEKNPEPDLNKTQFMGRHLNFNSIGGGPPDVLFDLDPKETSILPTMPSVNYGEFGVGILRTPAANGTGQEQSLILRLGRQASHGHPDKLHIDLYAMGDILMPGPGTSFPYNNNPRLENWFHTTISHNTLCVDELRQEVFDGVDQINNPNAHVDQVVYAPGSTVGLQRGWSNSVYSKVNVTMDRAVFMTTHYLVDLFGVFSTSPHKYDLAWHICGTASSDLKFEPMTFPEPVAKGYNTLTNVQNVTTDKEWNIRLTRGNHTARLFAAAGSETHVILADGGYYAGPVDKSKDKSTPDGRFPIVPTIIERRDKTQSTLYGNALDYSDDKEGCIKSVTQEGGLELGYGLLRVMTKNGMDVCFAAYRPGTHKLQGIETDALQAFVQMKGQNVETLYLAGGKLLKSGNASISRNEPGLAYIEKAPDGTYVVGNPSPSGATVTVMLPALAGLDFCTIDERNQKTQATNLTKDGSIVTLLLNAGGKVVFVHK